MKLQPSLFLLSLSLLATPALADKAAYCAAYARDFADARTADKDLWQHKYEIAQQACLTDPKPAVVAQKPPAVVAPQTAVEKPVVQAKPVAKVKVPDPIPPEPEVIERPSEKLVVATKSSRPRPGTDAWNKYCADKYTSFNIKTGTYMSRTGVERRCLVTSG